MIFDKSLGEVVEMFRPRKGIPPETVRAFRERRGWTLEQMADEVGAIPLEVAAWEAGTVRVPFLQEQQMRAIAAKTRPAPVHAPGPPALPRCAWAEAHAPGLYEALWLGWEVPSDAEVQRHLAECPACRRVMDRDRAVPLPAPAPQRAPKAPAGELGPEWDVWDILILAGAFAASVGLLAVLGATAVIGLEAGWPAQNLAMEVMAGLFTFALTGRLAGNCLPRRPYAAGLLAGVAGVLAAMLTGKLQMPDADLADPLVLAVCAGVAVSAGLLRGWMLDAAGDDEPADAHPSVASPAPVPLVPEGVPPAGLDGVIQRRGKHIAASDRIEA